MPAILVLTASALVLGLLADDFALQFGLQFLDACLEAGVNFLDTANSYNGGESESMLGGLLKGRRRRVVLGARGGAGGWRASSPRPRSPPGPAP